MVRLLLSRSVHGSVGSLIVRSLASCSSAHARPHAVRHRTRTRPEFCRLPPRRVRTLEHPPPALASEPHVQSWTDDEPAVRQGQIADQCSDHRTQTELRAVPFDGMTSRIQATAPARLISS